MPNTFFDPDMDENSPAPAEKEESADGSLSAKEREFVQRKPGRPRLINKRQQLTIYLPKEKLQEVDKVASDYGMTRNGFINAAISQALNNGLMVR
ncbi:hypothetical protein MUN46_011305 [Mesosutterella sp. AGMB02718]|uniref:CopG family transcriptional regulator n=1 Tax=Mesosutterella faecium TaxID=2925194 RepID=A0ABT7IQ54_9BURK|nr:hypothetical protein [Mesosutterella sp. AGMB02718]MDL2060523.1 hypothetical protein [Mesosutterella sp. AGMB02718]